MSGFWQTAPQSPSRTGGRKTRRGASKPGAGQQSVKAAHFMPEKELLANVRELAKVRGWLLYHTHDSRRSESGFPDLVMVRRDRCLFVELKAERGKLSDAQATWLGFLTGANQRGRVFIWKPSDWLSGEIERRLK